MFLNLAGTCKRPGLYKTFIHSSGFDDKPSSYNAILQGPEGKGI